MTCMVITAALALVLIWLSPDDFGVANQSMITFFIIGLASFLVWLTTMILEIRDRLSNR